MHPGPVDNHALHLFLFDPCLLLEKPLPSLVLALNLQNFPLLLRLVLSLRLHFDPTFHRSFFLNFLFLKKLEPSILLLLFVGHELVAVIRAANQRNPVLLSEILRRFGGHEALLTAEKVQAILELLQLGVRFFFVKD